MSRRHLSHSDPPTEITHRHGVLTGALDSIVDLLDQPNGRALDGMQRDDLSCLIELCAIEATAIYDQMLHAQVAAPATKKKGGRR